MERRFWISLLLRGFAFSWMVTAIICCLASEQWYLRASPVIAFIFAVVTILVILLSLLSLRTSTHNTVWFLMYAVMMLSALILAMTSGILFAVGTRVCIRAAYATCEVYYYSASLTVASIFSFICVLFCLAELVSALFLQVRKKHTIKTEDCTQTQDPDLFRSESDSSHFGRRTSSDIRVAHILHQIPIQTEL